jgi:hypothetical protein
VPAGAARRRSGSLGVVEGQSVSLGSVFKLGGA